MNSQGTPNFSLNSYTMSRYFLSCTSLLFTYSLSMSFPNSIGPWIWISLQLELTDDASSIAFAALNALISYRSFIFSRICRHSLKVPIFALALLESMSVKVQRPLTLYLSRKQEGPQLVAQFTPFGSLVMFITPYLTLSKSLAFEYILSNMRSSHCTREVRLRDPELLPVSNWLRQCVSFRKNSMYLMMQMWMMTGAQFSTQNCRFYRSAALYPSRLALFCRATLAALLSLLDFLCMYEIASYCS